MSPSIFIIQMFCDVCRGACMQQLPIFISGVGLVLCPVHRLHSRFILSTIHSLPYSLFYFWSWSQRKSMSNRLPMSIGSRFVIKDKIIMFQAPISILDRPEKKNCFTKHCWNVSMNCYAHHPRQTKNCPHVYLLILFHVHHIKNHFASWTRPIVKESSMTIKKRRET